MQQVEVRAITLGVVALAVQHQPLQGVIVFPLEAEAEEVVVAASGQQFARLFGILLVDPTRQLANATAFAKTSRITQHHHLLGQRMAAVEVFVEAAGAEGLRR